MRCQPEAASGRRSGSKAQSMPVCRKNRISIDLIGAAALLIDAERKSSGSTARNVPAENRKSSQSARFRRCQRTRLMSCLAIDEDEIENPSRRARCDPYLRLNNCPNRGTPIGLNHTVPYGTKPDLSAWDKVRPIYRYCGNGSPDQLTPTATRPWLRRLAPAFQHVELYRVGNDRSGYW